MGKLPSKQYNRFMYEFMVELARRRYEHTSNPLFAWEAYELCRSNGIALPEWISNYLDRVATGINSLKPDGKRLSTKTANCLEFNGELLEQREKYKREIAIVLLVVDRIYEDLASKGIEVTAQHLKQEPDKQSPYWDQVASEINKSASTVRRYYKKHISHINDYLFEKY